MHRAAAGRTVFLVQAHSVLVAWHRAPCRKESSASAVGLRNVQHWGEMIAASVRLVWPQDQTQSVCL